MTSGVFGKRPSMRLSGIFVMLLAVLFLAMSAVAYAEEITYTGDGSKLRNIPRWFDADPCSCSLFSGIVAPSLASGSRVIVNYNPKAPGVTAPEVVLGGLSELEDVARNEVILISGQVGDSIFGGRTDEGFATHNTVSVIGGAVIGDVCGGRSGSNDAVHNSVAITGGSLDGFVYSGGSIAGSATDNKITISGGSVGEGLYGGYSLEGDSARNTITISGGSVGSFASGGWSLDGSITDNVVAIIAGSVGDDVFGGWSYHSNATNNKVTISGGSVGKGVSGGYSFEGVVTGNTVIINGGSVGEAVYGGNSFAGDTVNNIVTISGGSVGGNIYGGFCTLGNATGNIVTISGGPSLTKAYIFGGYVYEAEVYNTDKDFFTGNTLNFESSGISAKGVGNFEYYNFYLPKKLTASAVMLSVTETVNLKGTTVEISLPGGIKLKKSDKIALIHSAAGVSGSPKNASCQAKQGDLLYEFSISADKNNLWAEVTKLSSAAK